MAAAVLLLTAAAGPDHPGDTEPCLRAADFASALPRSLAYRSDYTEMSASIQVTWRPEGAEDLLFLMAETMPDGITLWSQEVLFDRSLRPSRGSLVAGPDRELIYAYTKDADSVRGHRRGVGGGWEDVAASAGSETLLPGAFRALIPALDLVRCTTGSVSIYGASGAGSVESSYRVVGEAVAAVPAGRFEALAVEVRTPNGVAMMLVRRDFPHIILREEVPGSAAVNVLVAVAAGPPPGR